MTREHLMSLITKADLALEFYDNGELDRARAKAAEIVYLASLVADGWGSMGKENDINIS